MKPKPGNPNEPQRSNRGRKKFSASKQMGPEHDLHKNIRIATIGEIALGGQGKRCV